MLTLRGPVARIAAGALFLAALAATPGCRVLTGPCGVSTLTISPTSATLAVNQTRQFTATVRDSTGTIITPAVTWSVVSGGGSISSTGLFTAGTTPGTYTNTVRASGGGATATATVQVTATPSGSLATITLTPTSATLAQGATQQFVAVGKDAQGAVVSITPTWSVVAGGGSITTGGLFTAGSTAGTFTNTVRASSGSVSGTATIVVSPNTTVANTGGEDRAGLTR